MSDLLKKNKWFAHLSWANWGNISQLLFCHERPQRFAHCRSFNLSDSLTVAHLSWAIWANRSQSLIWSEQFKRMSNEQMRDEQMSSQPCLVVNFQIRHWLFFIKSANIFLRKTVFLLLQIHVWLDLLNERRNGTLFSWPNNPRHSLVKYGKTILGTAWSNMAKQF